MTEQRTTHDSRLCPHCGEEIIATDKNDERVLGWCHECGGRYSVPREKWAHPITDRTFISVTVDVHKALSLASAAMLLVQEHPELAFDLGFMAEAWLTNARIEGYRA